MKKFVSILSIIACVLAAAPEAFAQGQVGIGNFSSIRLNGIRLRSGNGNPEGAALGNVGDIYIRKDSPGGTYQKISGNGTSTGWILMSSGGGGGGGGVSSVALTAPSSIFNVSGSPITTSGTFALSLVDRSANVVFAGPASGSAAAPAWRKIIFADWDSNGCTSGQIPKWGGASWACADDAGASSGAPVGASYVAIATDATLTNERVLTAGSNITISDGGAGNPVTIAASIPSQGISQSTFLISGGQLAWQSAYTFNVSAATYAISGTQYTAPQTIVTLDAAHATLDRIDTIVATDAGTITKITGTPAAQPSEPDVDPGSQLKLGIVFVAAASVAPVGVSNTALYAENAGGPGEWNWTTSGTGFALASTTSPRTGTVDIEGTAVAAGAYAQGAIPSGTIDPNAQANLVFYLLSKATWANKRTLNVQFFSSGVARGAAVVIQTGAFGFNSANVATYQQIAIPISQFAIPAGTTVNQIRFTDAGGAIGFYLDDVFFQAGTSQTTAVGITQQQADARYAPLGPQFIVRAADPTLNNERVITAGTGITLTDSGAGGALTIAASGGSGAPTTATYITQTADATLSAEQALSALATGPVKVTTGTGVLTSGAINLGTEVTGTLAASSLGTSGTPEFARVGIGQAADAAAALAITGQMLSAEFNNGNTSTAQTVNWNSGNEQRSTLTGNVTFTFTNPKAGARYLLILVQDGTGGRTATWPANVKWPSGLAPTLTAGAGAVDLCTFAYSAANSGIYLGACNLDIR